MKLYYTGASETFGEQQNPNLSLGGRISNSIIPNGRGNNLFSELAINSGILNQKDQYFDIIGIAIYNDTEVDILNLKIFTENTDSIFIHKIGFSEFKTNEDGIYMESISKNSLPYESELVETSETSPLELVSLPSSSAIGLWIYRELLIDQVQEENSDENVIEDYYNNLSEKSKKSEMQLVIDYDD